MPYLHYTTNLKERLALVNYSEYVKLVAEAYMQAPDYDPSAVKHWNALNSSNYVLFQRLLSKTEIVFTSEDINEVISRKEKMTIKGKNFKLINQKDPYSSAEEMKADYEATGSLKISIDYSNHPVFSVEDNIVMRSVHDFIVHILGNHPFGDKGEIASYNRHAKLAPPLALPALFTEIVGQASVHSVSGDFPNQKIAVLPGFDYKEVGKVEGYSIENKKLTPAT